MAKQDGDISLLCSDGLTNMVEDSMILHSIDDISDITSLAHSLISQANAAGGKDNITVFLNSAQIFVE